MINEVRNQIKIFRNITLKKTELDMLAKEDCFNVHTDDMIYFHVLMSDLLTDNRLNIEV